MESFGRIIAILTAVVLICFYPLQSISAQQILIQDNYIQNETIKFVDQALQSGQITQEAYDRYLERIQLTEEPYSVRFTIAHLLDVYEEDLPVSRSSYSTFSLTENTYSTYSSRATHVHTDNCYAGHRHTDTCYDSHVHDSSCYEYEYATCYELYGGVNAYDSSGMDQITCNTCGAIGTMQVWKYYTSCTECGLGMMVHQYCESASCTNCGDGWYWDDGTLDSPCDREYLKSETLICSESEEPYLICPEAEDNTPICNRVVLTLTPTNSVQEVALGVTIDTTAIATFLDGSSSIVTCTSNYDSTILGVQTVTLTYGEFVDTAKNKVSKTATITVTVTEKITNITCPNGHTYPANTDGTDPGCPECVATLVPTLSATTVYSGAELPLTSLLVTYQDGHTETVTSGWTHNFDTTQCGTQAVTIQYKNGSCTTDIIVKPNPVGLSVTATPNEVLNGEEPIYTVTVLYEDGTSKVVTTGYIKTGFTAGAGTKQVIFSYTENGITVTDTIEVVVKRNTKTCPHGHTYELGDNDEDEGCPECVATLVPTLSATTVYSGAELPLTSLLVTYQDGHTETVTSGWTHNFDTTQCGTQAVTIQYKNGSCTTDIIVKPNPVGLSVTATPNEVLNGEEPIYTVTVLYEDGTSKVVTTGYTKTGFTAGAGTKQVIFSYTENGIIVTDTIEVVVKRNTKTCPHGHTYELGDNDEDKGCPECVATLVPTLSATTVYSGAELPLTSLLVTYQDGHTETVTSGWTHNFDTTQCGTQAVTIQYKNGSCTTDIIVKPNPVGLSVTATPNEVLNGEEPIYTVTVLYEDGTSKVVTTGYTKTGFTAGAGTKQVIFSYTENGITVTDTVEVIVKVKSHTCPVCGNTYDIDVEDTGCPVCKVTLQAIEAAPNKLTVRPGEVLTLTVTAIYQDGHTEDVTGWTHDYDNTKIGTQTVTVTYKNKTTTVEVVTQTTLQCDKCGATYEPAADGRDPGCPICQSVVIGITVSPFSQTVSYGAEISLTVRATYRDGHTEIVADWSSNYDPYLVGPQTITVFYQAMTAEATVTVLSNQMVVCPLCGQSYDAGLYPYGCPICAAMPVDLKAYLGTGGNQVTYGSQLGLDVILIYRDGHAEQVTEGWRVQNYNPYQLGMQQVQIAYQGLTTTLMIDVVTTLHSTTCPNGHTYYLEQDGSDPGCPYCAIPELDDTRYYDLTFTNEVTEHIFVDGYYFLEAGDLLSVEVSPRVESFWMQLQFIFTAADEHRRAVQYGGMRV